MWEEIIGFQEEVVFKVDKICVWFLQNLPSQ